MIYPSLVALVAFFNALQGSWDGNGVHRELGNDGQFQSVKYEVSSRYDSQDDDTWASDTQTTTEEGATSSAQNQFAVRDGNLFVSANGLTEPVKVTESTDHSITYQMDRAELYTGRVFHFTFHAEIAAGGKLHGRNTVELNGVLISEDLYDAARW